MYIKNCSAVVIYSDWIETITVFVSVMNKNVDECL